MARPKGYYIVANAIKELRDQEIAEVILRRRELEICELEALMQIAPNGITPSQTYHHFTLEERLVIQAEMSIGAYEFLHAKDETLLTRDNFIANKNRFIGAIIYDEEEK